MAVSSPTPQKLKSERSTNTEKFAPPKSGSKKLKSRSRLASKSKAHAPNPSEDEKDHSDHDLSSRGEDGGYQNHEKDDAYDSDAIDVDDFVAVAKRKRSASGSSRSLKKARTVDPQKKAKSKSKKARAKDEDKGLLELEDGQEVVGVVVQAPKTGQVPPGRVSQNTLDFLMQLKDPECNDRQWFKLHEPVYRQAENEWKAFVEAVTDQITEADPQVPPLPSKDLIHRIYRDVRFSNDKTPYKSNFSASFSRSGRKGIWAGCDPFRTDYKLSTDLALQIMCLCSIFSTWFSYLNFNIPGSLYSAVQPGGESIVAAGSWCPARNELMNIRINIQRRAGADRLREVISAPEFVAYFGEPCPSKDGSRQNIFGREDELKVAPKGIDKNHRDLDLLKCRSFAVVHRFLDSEVLAEDFAEKVGHVVRVMRPFVHCLNDMMTVTGSDTDDEQGDSPGDDD
ncbi:hypothetical protein J132_09132 [Termitomyces sp. J132]|nr:hypothetical protein J132_09132 [Termitomyces sp. J132]